MATHYLPKGFRALQGFYELLLGFVAKLAAIIAALNDTYVAYATVTPVVGKLNTAKAIVIKNPSMTDPNSNLVIPQRLLSFSDSILAILCY